jgi:MoxR-like ATPase
MIFNPKSGDFNVRRGPIFANIVLADEINRAPSKVQSALLEAMQEKHVTIGDTTYELPHLFLVLATQNPLEQEGTYPLPEAQIDRFMLKVVMGYPTAEEEKAIVNRVSGPGLGDPRHVATEEDILRCRKLASSVYMDDKILDYIVSLVAATRDPAAAGLGDLAPLIEYGASPRTSISLARASKAHALLRGRAYVTPEDVKAIGMDVMRHRVLLTYEAEAEDVRAENVVQRVFDKVEVP